MSAREPSPMPRCDMCEKAFRARFLGVFEVRTNIVTIRRRLCWICSRHYYAAAVVVGDSIREIEPIEGQRVSDNR